MFGGPVRSSAHGGDRYGDSLGPVHSRGGDERAATLKLNTAKKLVDEDKKKRAIQVLEDLLEKYPKSKAADEAKELLEKLKD